MLAALAVFCGGGIGALARWALTLLVKTNSPFSLAILIANLCGGFLIGVAIGWLNQASTNEANSEIWRLFLIVGLLGGLTTFSSFSAEVFHLINSSKLDLALLVIASHLFGSLLFTYLGWLAWAKLL